MTTRDKAGLSFEESYREAEKQAESAESAPSSADDGSQPIEGSEGEQPTVENDDNTGLFGVTVDDNPEGEQSTDVNSLTVDVDGRQMTVNQLRDEHMMQADYTRKTQELAEARKEHDKAIVLWDALQKDPTETVRQLYVRMNAGQTPVEGVQAPVQGDVDINALVEQKLQEKLDSNPRLQALEATAAINEVNQAFTGIEQDNNIELIASDRKIIMERAVELGTSDLGFVFDGMMHQRAAQDAERDNAKSVSTATGTRGDASNEPEEKEMVDDWADAVDKTKRDLHFPTAVSNV